MSTVLVALTSYAGITTHLDGKSWPVNTSTLSLTPKISWDCSQGKAQRNAQNRAVGRGQAEVTGEPGVDEEVRQGQCGYYSFRFTAEVARKRNFEPLFRSR